MGSPELVAGWAARGLSCFSGSPWTKEVSRAGCWGTVGLGVKGGAGGGNGPACGGGGTKPVPLNRPISGNPVGVRLGSKKLRIERD